MNVEEFLPKRRSLWTYFVLEPLYKPVIEFFLNAGWHPNTVSAISVGFAVASVASFSLGRGYSSLFLGALFFELAYFFDCDRSHVPPGSSPGWVWDSRWWVIR